MQVPIGSGTLRLRQLEAFQEVMRTGSITRAGQAMGVSQPGVSRLLADLERQLGFRLFERRGTRVHPTPEAVRFLRHVERSFVGLGALRAAADEIANARGAELRVAAFPAASLQLVPACIAQFNAAYPEARVSVTVTNSPRVAELVSMLQAEVGITTLPVVSGAVVTANEIRLSCVCVLPRGHRLSRAGAVHATDLHGERLVKLDPGFASSRGLQAGLQGAQAHPLPGIDVSFSYAACEMVRQGAGIAVVDPLTALAFESREVVFRPFLPSVDFSFGIVRTAHGPASLVGERIVNLFGLAMRDVEKRLDVMLGPGMPARRTANRRRSH